MSDEPIKTEVIEPEPPVMKAGGNSIARIIIECDVVNGSLSITGHLTNKYMVLQILAEAAHSIMKDKNIIDMTPMTPLEPGN